MSFRRRLLAVLALTVFLTVGAVSWVVSVRTRRTFERADGERSEALVAQFRREFARRGEDVVRRVEAIAGSDSTARIAVELGRGADYSAYLMEAKATADSHQLDLLEFVAPDGTIISSAQWPARFGYKEDVPGSNSGKGTVLRLEALPDGATLGLVAERSVQIGDKPLYVIGGEQLDRRFLSSLTLPAGMRVLLYRNVEPGFSRAMLIGPAGEVANADKLAPLIADVQQHGNDAERVVQWSANAADSETFHAIPLQGEKGAALGVLLVGSSRRSLIELQRHIGAFALIVGGAGILLAILLSGWVAARVTKPIERLADAAREVADGHWGTQVQVRSADELGELADAFNTMTRQLAEQRDRLVQAERVAAWRELARRLAHELKNPLFPLQITVENLLRAREQNPDQFEEVFRESTATLLAELANLKAIIGRFSDFSKMPQPQLRAVQINDIALQVLALHAAQLQGKAEVKLELGDGLPPIAADPDLLHRALSNLVLNALDAMPEGGSVTVRSRDLGSQVRVEVADTGSGLTSEECERLFTPYYTTKHHGTGLGLAIVQSVVSDHGGSISVESTPGKGTTFRIDLPKRTAAPEKSPELFTSAMIS